MKKILEYLESKFYLTPRMEDEAFQNGDCDIRDWSGGNFDDAYSMGTQDGRQETIQELIYKIKAGEFND